MSRMILVVNGSPSRRQTCRGLLERAGYEVREIVSLDAALAAARQSPPLAVVVEAPADREVPAAFARRLRRHPTTARVPVLVLDRGDDVPAAPPADDLGSVTWLPEPCPPRTLLEEVAYLTRTDARWHPSGAPGPSSPS